MRIAVDARELHGQPTGVGRYLAEILAAWDRLPATHAHEVILCAPDPIDCSGLNHLRISVMTSSGSGTLWEQLTLPRLVHRASADVLFAPGYTGPLRGAAPMILSVHDVSFAAHPEWFAHKEGFRRRTLTRLAARRAARVLTLSEFSKREIVERLGIESGKVDVVYPGVTLISPVARTQPAFAAARLRRAEQGSRHMHEPTVLYVGSLFNRRHIPEMIEGFARLARHRAGTRLEIVGDNRTTPRIDVDRVVRTTGAGDRVRVRSYVSDDELGALYGRAAAFVFLSEYEGFGLTPLEALASGIPIVVLETPVAREIYGSAALYVDRPDPALIEAALDRALFDEAERARVLSAAPEVLARYSWHECATKVLEVLVHAGDAAPLNRHRHV